MGFILLKFKIIFRKVIIIKFSIQSIHCIKFKCSSKNNIAKKIVKIGPPDQMMEDLEVVSIQC
ncbi:hypothetical protein GA0116959_10698 [Acinetobacter albensis]|uniref:Uncharacterized protein n=1 Tax=Acinetobacter albensis TaxID=1673609 RepID=A0A1C4GUI3_9GAMM|nr:hypothetical protein GA0116959_10698 [Acinetobacter albensis]